MKIYEINVLKLVKINHNNENDYYKKKMNEWYKFNWSDFWIIFHSGYFIHSFNCHQNIYFSVEDQIFFEIFKI